MVRIARPENGRSSESADLFLRRGAFGRFAPGSANLMTSLVFLGAHLPRWLWRAGLSEVVFANAFGYSH
jgi:hypothetical protein